MKTLPLMAARRRQRGGVAVEMAIVLPLLVLFLALPLFFGRVFWYYSVAQKAAHDAARYLSAATQSEIRGAGATGGETATAALARAIVNEELASIRPGIAEWTITVLCDTDTCGLAVPQTIRVSIRMIVRDDIFDFYTSQFYGEDGYGLLLKADVTMRYVGN